MASADLMKELDCAICLHIYGDPVTLSCGHSFCQGCIVPLLDTQEESGYSYSCPECREHFPGRPELHKNVALNNIAATFRASQPDHTGPLCTYCIHTPAPAVKSCRHCEASLCEDHASAHSRSPEHVLSDPADANRGTRNCSVHKKVLEYYCAGDAACICASWPISEERWGQLAKTVNEASEKKKSASRNALREMTKEKENLEERLRNLRERKGKLQGKAESEAERVAPLFRDIKRQLEGLEKRVLREISREAAQASLSDLIQELEIKKDKLSQEMGPIEEMFNATELLTILQKPNAEIFWDSEDEEDQDEDEDDTHCAGGDLDVTRISHTLRTIFDIITGVNVCFYKQEVTGISLDADTAHNYVKINKKSVSRATSSQGRPEFSERFQDDYQVLSNESFSSGRHYWEVGIGWSDEWSFGVCYPSVDRRGNQARIGNNDQSWALVKWDKQLSVIHDRKAVLLPYEIISKRFRVYLDYEGGRISFYDLCDPIRHIYTIEAAFTEPLHAVLGVLSKSSSLEFS